MKKSLTRKALSLFISLILIASMALSVIVTAYAEQPAQAEKKSVNEKALKREAAVDKLKMKSEAAGKEFTADWDGEKCIPVFIAGKLSDKAVKSSEEAAGFLMENKDIFTLGAAGIKVKSSQSDAMGSTHYRCEAVSDGIPVYGQEVIVHTDAKGDVYAINGELEANIPEKKWSKDVKVSPQEAIAAAKAALDFVPIEDTFGNKPDAQLYLYESDGQWQPVYVTTLQFANPYPADMKIFVSAATGKVLLKRNEVKGVAVPGSGLGIHGEYRTLILDLVNGIYYLKDTTRGNGIYTYDNTGLVSDTDGKLAEPTQAPAVDTHFSGETFYDYYKNNFNRNSYDGAGAAIKMVLNYGTGSGGAYWNGSQLIIGDGSGTDFGHLCDPDIIGHELTHAVIDYTCNLSYQNQPGAISESLADCFGYLIEGDADDWLIGEDANDTNPPAGVVTNIAYPTATGQVDDMDNYLNTTADNGGVHTNKGILNKAFYYTALALGNSKIAPIYYRAMSVYLTSTANFTGFRSALQQSAADFYGTGSYEYTAIQNCFAMVGIGTPAAPAGDNYESNGTMATAYGPILSGLRRYSMIYTASDVDYYYFNASGAGTITVDLKYLPKDYDLYLYNESGALVGSSTNSSLTNETISYAISAAGKYYIKVVGYGGVYSSTATYMLKATFPQTMLLKKWYSDTAAIDSPHNYPANYNGSNEYYKSGAVKMLLCFSQLETEKGHDFVTVKDKNGITVAKYDGKQGGLWVMVEGDRATITLTSDGLTQAYGYHVNNELYYASSLILPPTYPPVITNPIQL